MSDPISELPTGLKWSFDHDPSTGGHIPRIMIIDPSSGGSIFIDDALTAIDFAHREVHEGETYQVTTYTGSVATNEFWGVMLSLTGSSQYAHLTWSIAAGADAEVRFYQNVTGTNYGTKIEAINMDLGCPHQSWVEVFVNPTITTFNTIVHNSLLPGGSGPQSGGGTFRQDTEFILDIGKRYYLQVYNRGTGAQPMSIGVQWYESDIGHA